MKNDQRRLRDRVAVFACIAIATIAIDQLTKMWALSALADGRTIRVIPGLLSLTLVRNPGASLGMGSGMTWLISLLAMAACVALVVLAVRTISMKWTVVFALAFAGALGNLIDRVMYAEGFLNGKVVDFLNYLVDGHDSVDESLSLSIGCKIEFAFQGVAILCDVWTGRAYIVDKPLCKRIEPFADVFLWMSVPHIFLNLDLQGRVG